MNTPTEIEIETEAARLHRVGRATLYPFMLAHGMIDPDDTRFEAVRHGAAGKPVRSPSYVSPPEMWFLILVVSLILGFCFNHMADYGNDQLRQWKAEEARRVQIENSVPEGMATR